MTKVMTTKTHEELVELIVGDDINTILLGNEGDYLQSILELGHTGYCECSQEELYEIASDRGLLVGEDYEHE